MTTNTIFIFGDSFADCSNHQFSGDDDWEKLWPGILNGLLEDHTKRSWEVINCAVLGSSLDFSWYQFRENVKYFKPGDLVVFLVTDASRFWFIDDRPDISNASTINLDEILKHDVKNDWEEINQAIASHFRHISRPDLNCIRSTQIIENFDYWANRLPQTRFVLLPCFPQQMLGPQLLGVINDSIDDWDITDKLAKTRGNLLHVQQNEFDFVSNEEYWKIHNWMGWDIRYCHLSIDNHHVLARKLLRAWQTNDPIDLTTGFKKNIYTKDMLDVANLPSDLLDQVNRVVVDHVRSTNVDDNQAISWINRFVRKSSV